MGKKCFKVQTYSSVNDQHLRNVHIYAPSIIWVKSGVKTIHQGLEHYDVNHQSWLLTGADQALSFINKPVSDSFYSVQLCFLLPPPLNMLEVSHKNQRHQKQHNRLHVSSTLAYGFSLLVEISSQNLSDEVQQYHLFAFYQQLAEVGALHLLFSEPHDSLLMKLSAYFSKNPAENHQLDDVSHHFSMSRSTLIRRLHQDGTNFKTVLANVRMNHALSLMQAKKQSQLDIALQCGYLSETRFGQRFHQQFGITPKEYMKTLPY